MRIDLHTHSRVSDGTMSPADVVRRAAETGLDVVALTDHDTAAGWAEAEEAARQAGIGFVPGIELSSKHAGRGVHVLAYLADPEHPGLAAEMVSILDGRAGRLEAMLGGLASVGVLLTAEEVRRQVGEHGVVGRPHVADALVARGIVHDRREAFDLLLAPGRAGFAVRYAPSVSDLVRLVSDAGGAAVIAHPWGRGSRDVLDVSTIAGLRDAGLVGLEADHEDHSPADRAALRSLAADLDLVVTGASDYHGAGKVDHDLGCNLTAPDQFERLLAAAADNAARYARPVPRIVAPAPVAR